MWGLVKHIALSVLISSNTQASTQHKVQAKPPQPQAVIVIGIDKKQRKKPLIFSPKE